MLGATWPGPPRFWGVGGQTVGLTGHEIPLDELEDTPMAHKVGIIGGDGIGPEVIAEGLRVIEAAGVELDTVDYDLGGARYLKDGVILTDEILDAFAVVGEPGTIVPSFVERYGDIVDRTMMTVPAKNDDEAKDMLAKLRAA